MFGYSVVDVLCGLLNDGLVHKNYRFYSANKTSYDRIDVYIYV